MFEEGKRLRYNVIFYKDKHGREPIPEFIRGLAEKGKTSRHARLNKEKILTYIRALELYGTKIGMPVVRHIGGGIWELRPLDNQILFFYWMEDTFVLLHHFIKKTQKTPLREIEQAKRNLADFLESED